ncbi:MAG TPA: PIN domain-containing protein [Spirochaetia bacterium]
MFLVDSTLYIDLLRAKRDPVEVLRPWLLHEEIICCGVIRCEVLRGIVNKRVHERMCELFDALGPIDIDAPMWEETAHLAWALDRRGKVLPLTDLLIAGCALRVGATVISSDEHFKEVPGLAIAEALPTR